MVITYNPLKTVHVFANFEALHVNKKIAVSDYYTFSAKKWVLKSHI